LAVLNTRGGERKKEEMESVLNTVLNTVRVVKSFSVKPEHCHTLACFVELIKREGLDFSAGVMKALTEYVEHHSVPNPQARLDRCLAIEMPHKPAWQCCVPNCENKARFQLILADYEGKTEVFRVCVTHKRWKHKRFCFLEGFKELKM